MKKQPKKLYRRGPRGKVTTGAAIAARAARMQTHSIQVPGVNINLFNKFSAGPFQIVNVIVPRIRAGVPVEVKKRCIVGAALVPLVYGPRKFLVKQLAKYEFGYAKYLMTKGTKAEGL